MKSFVSSAVIILSFSMIACKGGIDKELERFSGQKVVLPQNMTVSLNGKDTLLNRPYKDIKLVVWYDSTGCSSCRLKELWQWEEYAGYADSAGIDFMVILSPAGQNTHSVNIAVKSQRVKFPVYKDYDLELYGMNPGMPANPALHTFLLDKDNQVVIAGNPLKNPRLDGLYRTVVSSLIKESEAGS